MKKIEITKQQREIYNKLIEAHKTTPLMNQVSVPNYLKKLTIWIEDYYKNIYGKN